MLGNASNKFTKQAQGRITSRRAFQDTLEGLRAWIVLLPLLLLLLTPFPKHNVIHDSNAPFSTNVKDPNTQTTSHDHINEMSSTS